MNEPGLRGDRAGPGELARLAAIVRVAIAKGWGRYAERLGCAGFLIAGALGIAWAVLALKSGRM